MNVGSRKKSDNVQSRLFAVFAAAILAFSMGALAGCGSSNAASSSASPSASQSASAAASSSASSADSGSSAASASEAAQLHVTVTVDLTAADGAVEEAEAVVPAGATVLDATQATNFTLDVQDSQYGKFVNAINGVATGDKGGQSGWLVAVNGTDLTVSADAQEVSDGDQVQWRYVTSFE